MTSMIQCLRCSNPEDLALRAAACFGQSARTAMDSRSSFTVALAGGSTPQAFHRALAKGAGGALDTVRFLFSDERAVPPDHPESNFGAAYRDLLGPAGVPKEYIFRIKADDGDPARAARRYSELIRVEFDARIDLVILGLGSDGHTASLFPGGALDDAAGSPAIPTSAPSGAPITARVSLSLTQIARAEEVLILVSGRSKADVLHAALAVERERPCDPRGFLPVQRVLYERQIAGRAVTVLADAAALRDERPALRE